LIIKFLATTFSKQQRIVLKLFLMKNFYSFLCLVVCMGFQTSTSAQATTEYFYTTAGSTYTQDFNGLTQSVTVTALNAAAGTLAYNLSDAPMNATGLTGWQVQQTSGSGVPEYGANTGSSSAGRCYSYGASGGANRSLGLLAGSTFRGRIGMIITNSTGAALNAFTITYTGKQWRGGNTAAQSLAFKYKITVNGNTVNQTSYTAETNLNFTTPSVNGTNGALDGDNVANQVSKNYTVSGLTWPAGQRLAIVWDDTDDSGNDAALAIDDFTFTATAPALSVALENITAKANGAVNQLAWTTASEKDNALFTIERSPNGQDFTPIGTVKGNGTTQSRNDYTFSDETPLSKSYYRLRQTDFNGSETTSKTVSVAREKGGLAARVYPSVTKGDMTVELSNESPATVFISNIFGQTVFTQTGLIGTNPLSINHLSAGTYFLTVSQAGSQTVHKLVKQ
jgi:Secretion system C-terminal sorting domain